MSSQIRVAVVSHAAVVAINQEPFHELARAGAQVTLVAPRALDTDIRGRVELSALPGFAGDLLGLSVVIGGYKRHLGGQRGIHLIAYRGLARALASARPDVLFVEEEPYSLAALQCMRIADRLGIPFVIHENQNILRRVPPPFEQVRARVLARAAGVTVRNTAAEDLVRRLGFTGPVGSFPHGVDPARFAPSPHAGRTVGFVGRLVPEKGIMLLIDALAEVAGATLLVVGDGPIAGAARARASAAGVEARFTGAVAHERVPSLYADMDVVAIPSLTTPTWMEQFGRIVIEANAASVPVVAFDSGELGATVAATGGGVVVPEGDVAALRAALADLLDRPAERGAMGEQARAAVAERFTPQAIAQRFLAFLSEVLQR